MKAKIYLLTIIFFTTIFVPFTTAKENKNADEAFITSAEPPVYQAPVNNSNTKRRRIGGTAVSAHRGLTRGLGKSLSRRLARGLAKKSKPVSRERLLAKNDSEKSVARKLPKYLSPMAPEHVGLTANPQPVIYFYISSAWPDRVEFTLNEEGAVKPVLKTSIQGPGKAEILGIDLKAHNIKLKPNKEYEWFVSILPNPADSSSKIFAGAVIKYNKPSIALLKKLQTTAKERRQYIYAKAGYFYDTMEHLANLIQAGTGRGFKIQRAALLKQVKLSFVKEI